MFSHTADMPSSTWRALPTSLTHATCRVWAMEAGSLTIPDDMVFLPKPETANPSVHESEDQVKQRSYRAPCLVFLIEHLPTKEFYIFDLGIPQDLSSLTRHTLDVDLPFFTCNSKSVADILSQSGPQDYTPSGVKAIIFSHLHFDHIGDCGRHQLHGAQLWVGPSSFSSVSPCCTAAVQLGSQLSLPVRDFQPAPIQEVVEFSVPLAASDAERAERVRKAKEQGLYNGIKIHEPEQEWHPIGSFDMGLDLFGDQSLYLLDSPGHCAGHVNLLVRVKTNTSGPDDFLLLAGDAFHHPVLLKDPELTARKPYSAFEIHDDVDIAMNTIRRLQMFNQQDYVWVIAAHDFAASQAIFERGSEEKLSVIPVNNWREEGLKQLSSEGI